MQLGELDGYRQMVGSGELWVNADGLPARLALDLDMGSNEAGEQITAVITTEFSNFDMTLLQTTFLAAPQTWLSAKLPTAAVQQQVGINASLMLLPHCLFSPFCRLLAKTVDVPRHHHHHHRLPHLLPLLNGEVAHAYYERSRAQQATNQEQQELTDNAQQALKNEWNPHQNPLTKKTLHKTAVGVTETAR